MRLAQRELPAGRELQRPVGEVLPDGDSGHVVPPVGLGDPVGRRPITMTSSTSQSTVSPESVTSSYGPARLAGNLVNVAGTPGTSLPDSAACER